MWTNPIYDRTSGDVSRVKTLDDKIKASGWDNLSGGEKTEYLTGLKGALNAFDLNRIEGNTEYLEDTLRGYGYSVIIDTHKTDWAKTDFPYPTELERVRANVEKLKDHYYAFTAIPDSIEKPTFTKINAIEKIHQEIFDLIDLMLEGFRNVGTFYLNEDFNF